MAISQAEFNKAHQFAAGGRRTPFSLRLRLHYKGAVVRWRYAVSGVMQEWK